MNCWKNIFAVGLLAVSTHSVAEVYYHIGGGMDKVTHDKSDENYTLLDLKAGLGYKLVENYSIELDVTANSSAKKSGDGLCITTINTIVSCTKSQKYRGK